MHASQKVCEQLGCCWHAAGVAPSHHKCIKKENGSEPAPVPPRKPAKCCIMQSAAALLQYPLGLEMPETIRRNDLAYYEPRTRSNGFFTGDSIYSIAWLALGNATAALTQWDAAVSPCLPLAPLPRPNASHGGGSSRTWTAMLSACSGRS